MNVAAKQTMKKEEAKEADLIVETSNEVENLTKEAAFEIVPSLMESVDFSYFKLGGVLSVIQDNGWWKDDSSSFKEFVPYRFGLHYRKAMYLIKIYDGLVEADIPWSKVSGLGWTKLKELADILTSDNVDEWVALAKSMSVLQLAEAVKSFKAGNLSTKGTTDPDTSGVTTLTFKVHPDQKESIKQAVDQALEEAGTEFKGVALEAICLNYLAGGSSTGEAKTMSLTSVMGQFSAEQVLEAFEVCFPDINLTAEME